MPGPATSNVLAKQFLRSIHHFAGKIIWWFPYFSRSVNGLNGTVFKTLRRIDCLGVSFAFVWSVCMWARWKRCNINHSTIMIKKTAAYASCSSIMNTPKLYIINCKWTKNDDVEPKATASPATANDADGDDDSRTKRCFSLDERSYETALSVAHKQHSPVYRWLVYNRIQCVRNSHHKTQSVLTTNNRSGKKNNNNNNSEEQ